METPTPVTNNMYVFGFIFKIKHFLKYNHVNVMNCG